ncbi:nitroreductase [Maritimibacter sp. UBA3975]|uniref:nitroreductase family protein n=1 Tax=Maritimibacter sp. UBA3975 TaxID=1946833 RepID=UPI000C0A445B|nr:nitroreductase [Maritimibacter sp. UBA3975]MAM63901.1 nitroreductase [Maritimibacter sp.]|tara:strand:- start:39134 stop:39712 length:579 start_codon:yes stop_codon:yes gene_type:complete
MPDKNPAALDFLLTRRSRPAKTLTTPVPGREEVETILTAAARTPDHGKLEPWRFIVLTKPALDRLAAMVPPRGATLNIDAEKIEKSRRQFADADLAVAVVFCPVDSPKVPTVEQQYSAGAVCLSLLNAALAAGWGANWLSGWPSHDPEFVQSGLGLAAHESIAGFIHIGTETAAPPDRPRPDLSDITLWVDA